jgi:hypothetical protein
MVPKDEQHSLPNVFLNVANLNVFLNVANLNVFLNVANLNVAEKFPELSQEFPCPKLHRLMNPQFSLSAEEPEVSLLNA